MKKRKKLRSGFTMVELIVVILIVAILGAVAIPSILSFIESGRQTNRMDVARSLYLGAQNQLTELRVTRGLDTAINELGGSAISPASRVFNALGSPANWPDPGNEELVHYISKPAGQPMSHDNNKLMNRLLSTVVVNREVLDNDAILIEFNIETGVVMSVFCSDRFEAGGQFVYIEGAEGSIRHETGGGIRGMGADGYEPTARSRARRQGYYGVENTGQLPNLGYPIVSLHDGANVPMSLPDDHPTAERTEYNGNTNILYAPILIPTDMAEEFDIRINGNRYATMRRPTSPDADGSNRHTPVLVDPEDTSPPGSTPIIIEAIAQDDDYYAYYLILDYLGRDGTKKDIDDIYIDGNIDTDAPINVGVRLRRNGTHATSNDWNPYFDGAVDSNGSYGIATGRHLYNVRRALDKNFILRRDIDFAPDSDSYVSNFEPIRDPLNSTIGFKGRFEGNRQVIYHLTVTTPGDAGLFAVIDDGGEVNNLTLENPKVESTGSNAGAVSGRNRGTINAAFIRFNSRYNGRTIKGAITGGITGENEKDIIDAVFISPLSEEHIQTGGVSSGGIAGRNAGGTIKRALFLALAPKESGGTIVPITVDGTVEHTYFLSGEPVRPGENEIDEIATGRNGFNRETVRGYGRGMTTWAFYDRLNRTEGYTLSDWTKLPNLTEPDIVTQYPYPFVPIWNSSESALTIIPRESPGVKFPVAGTIESISPTRSLAYYEATGDVDNLQIGLSYRYSSIIDLPQYAQPLINEGYALSLVHAAEIKIDIAGTEYILRGGADSDNPSWSWAENAILAEQGLMFTNTPIWREREEYDEDLGENITVEGYQLFLDNDVLEKLSGGSFIDLTATVGDDNTVVAHSRFNPMFANTVIDTDSTLSPEHSFGTVPNPYVIRSPRHLSNISSQSSAPPANSNFKQDLDIDFATYRKAVDTAGGRVSAVDESQMLFPNRAVVTETFSGFYAGSGHDIWNAAAQTGIFSVIGNTGTIENVNLVNTTITASSGFGAGALAGINNGTIRSISVQSSSVTAIGAGNFSVGGITAVNNSVISNVTVTATAVTAPNGTAGGVAGTNDGGGVISSATVSGGSVRIVGRIGVAGGIAGNNVAGIPEIANNPFPGGVIESSNATGTVLSAPPAPDGRTGSTAATNGGTIR